MITSIEIAKILSAKSPKKKAKTGFDAAIEGLGVRLKARKKDSKRN